MFNLNHILPEEVTDAYCEHFSCLSLGGKSIRVTWDLNSRVSSYVGTCTVSPQVCEPALYSWS